MNFVEGMATKFSSSGSESAAADAEQGTSRAREMPLGRAKPQLGPRCRLVSRVHACTGPRSAAKLDRARIIDESL